jgi:hypothetical protein
MCKIIIRRLNFSFFLFFFFPFQNINLEHGLYVLGEILNA